MRALNRFCRYFVAVVIVFYGFAKLTGRQFTILDSELDKPLRDVSGFWLSWYYFGYSAVYGSFIATIPIVGGLMLTARRTLLGACILFGVVSNAAMPQQACGQQQKLFELAARADAADSAGQYAEALKLWGAVSAINGGDPGPLYIAARSATRAGKRDTAFALLDHAVDDGLVLSHSPSEDTVLTPLHGDPRWTAFVAHARDIAARRDTALRTELLRLAVADQANRATIGATLTKYGGHSRESDSAMAVMLAADSPLQARLRAIVRAHGWPGRRLVGDDGAHAAWLLLQHADSSYQGTMLPMLWASVQRGDTRAADAAYLDDRVRVDEGLPQRYGTQLSNPPEPGMPPALRLIEDRRCVDRRRAAVQLPPLADYAGTFGVHYTPPLERCPD